MVKPQAKAAIRRDRCHEPFHVRWVCGLIVLLAVAFGAGPATAEGQSGSQVPRSLSNDEALHVDIAMWAEANGWSLNDAVTRYQAAEAVGAVAEAVASSRPEIFVGSAMSERLGDPPTLFIKGPADDFVWKLVNSAPVRILVADRQPYSLSELELRNHRVHQAVAQMGFQNIASSFDITAEGRLFVGVRTRSGLPNTDTAIRARLPVDLQENVTITISETRVVEDYTAFGGMWVLDNGANACTSGWSVVDSFGRTGVTTAGHCSGIDQIYHPGEGLHNLLFFAQHRGQWGDIEWHTPDSGAPATFYSDATNVRNVTFVEPISSMTIGEPVCAYGRASNLRDCSATIEVVSQECTNSGVWNGRLVRMNKVVGTNGDSGGGFSFGTVAFGSMKGRCGPDHTDKVTFSAAAYYDEAVGVTVRTQ